MRKSKMRRYGKYIPAFLGTGMVASVAWAVFASIQIFLI